jgi:integrase
MIRASSVLSHPEQLSLNKSEVQQFTAFIEFLESRPNPMGQVLLGFEQAPWQPSDAMGLEQLVVNHGADEKQKTAFLAIAHNAAHFWSKANGQNVILPRFYFRRVERPSATPFCLADETARYYRWVDQLRAWIEELFSVPTDNVANREVLLAASIVSSMLHAGTFGERVIAGVVRAIACHRERSFIVNGRLHVELFLSWGMVADGETRIWVPDSLSSCLWSWLDPSDVAHLLVPIPARASTRAPKDLEIFGRIGRLLTNCCAPDARSMLGTIFDLRRCCLAMAHPHLNPLLSHYGEGEISANSPHRESLRRLFPKGEFIAFSAPENPNCRLREPSLESSGALKPDILNRSDESAAHSGGKGNSASTNAHPWLAIVCGAAAVKAPRRSLEEVVKAGGPQALLAGFGISLISSPTYTGERVRHCDLPGILKMVGESLADDMEAEDLGSIGPDKALKIYVRAIERRSVSQRLFLIKWILELDLFIRTNVKLRDPIPLKKLPWPPEDSALDPEFITHEEYLKILRRIDECWNASDSPRRRRMIRLIVVIAFRLGLRGGEIQQLRVGHLLVRGEPEILLWEIGDDQFKSRNARRRVPLRPLLSNDELEDLIDWRDERVAEEATGADRLFAIPDENLRGVSHSLIEELNLFLREHSKVGTEDGFLHVHTLRHACQSWMFTAMTLASGNIARSPFPDLPHSTAWLDLESERWKAIWGHPTAKAAFLQACLAGHGEFFTTARSYIHFFPWVLASFLDASEAMEPSDRLVRKASGKAESTVRRWGIHDIARNKLFDRYRATAVKIPEIDPSALGPRPAISALQATWNLLFAQATTEPAREMDPDRKGALMRAAQVAWIHLPDGAFGHRMELDRVGELLIAPPRPMRKHEAWASGIFDRTAAAPPEAVQAGLKIFAERVDLDGIVRFVPETDGEHARCYIRLLCEIGFSRDSIAMSHDEQAWKERLGYQGIYLNWVPAPSTQGPVLSVWPDLKASESGDIRGMRTALRYALVMAYIRFGGGTGDGASQVM